MGCERSPGTGEQATLGRREIHISGHRGQGNLMLVGDDDELFELSWLTVEAVEAPDQDPIDGIVLNIPEQALVCRPRLAGIEGTAVVIHVDAGHLPMTARRFVTTIVFLTLHTEALT